MSSIKYNNLGIALLIFPQEMGVYGTLNNIEEFNLSLIPFDSDLLSMEMDTAFRVRVILRS